MDKNIVAQFEASDLKRIMPVSKIAFNFKDETTGNIKIQLNAILVEVAA